MAKKERSKRPDVGLGFCLRMLLLIWLSEVDQWCLILGFCIPKHTFANFEVNNDTFENFDEPLILILSSL